MAEEESVKVAVRMRLFNGREKNAGATRIVRMQNEDRGSKTYIMNPETSEEKSFSFDFSFQSHSESEQGIGPYATQDTVFNDLGKPVLYSALEGRNVCLFAYGQTGAGKSFSMLGKANPPEMQGIIPRSCLEIFRLRDLEKDDTLVEYNIQMQVVEIYCEQINDLLDDRKNWPVNGHKPRLTKDGYIVETITRPCFIYEDIEKSFSFADKNRSVGSHALNPESSRAHTIYTIAYQRTKKTSAEAKQKETIASRINLVDLAGSERSESAGTSGQMLKEGNAINLSLTALGSTIKALSEGKRPNFRDSKLTLLLQGSMTNGKVIMIAAVSPASICYDESMSTLRFAERIKMVKIRAKKNVTQDPVAEIKKEMEEMRARMQEEIENLKTQCGEATPEGREAAEQKLEELLTTKKEGEKQLKEDFEKRLKEMSETEDDRRKKANAINKNWDGAFQGASGLRPEDVKDPHLRNLNEDPRLAETLVYIFKKDITKIGKADKSDPPSIEFNGMGITKGHCTVERTADNKLFLTSNSSSTFVNGKTIEGRIELTHNNRLWLGNNYAFRVVYPGQEEHGEQFEATPDYLFAEAEKAEAVQQCAPGMDAALGHQLSEALKKVEQANIIASDLSCECAFEPKIMTTDTGETAVAVSVSMPQGLLVWPWEKFSSRLVEMVRIWQQFEHCRGSGETFEMPAVNDPNNPFQDFEDQLLGECHVLIQCLGNMIDADAAGGTSILSPTACSQGKLYTSISPLDKEGKEGPWEDDEDNDPFVDSPTMLIDQKIQWLVKINKIEFDAADMLANRSTSCKFDKVWVRYKIWPKDPTEEWKCTEAFPDPCLNPSYTFIHKHEQLVTKEFCKHLEGGAIRFQVWGKVLATGGSVESNTKERQAEIVTQLKKHFPEVDPAGLPQGWHVVPLYKDPEGNLHHRAPV